MRTIGFGSVEGRYVFMDERTDSYFVIDRNLQADIDQVVRDGGVLRRESRLRPTLGVGDDPVRVIRADEIPPRRSLLEELEPPRGRLGDVLHAAFLLWLTASQLRSRSIEAVLGDAFSEDREPVSDDRPIGETLRFMAARRFVPFRRNCLLDSLALVRWLGAAKRHVSIMFGVKLDPFAAHCWLQSGTLLLNDRTENVAAFTPVREIGCLHLTP